jgi:hypothetical protein
MPNWIQNALYMVGNAINNLANDVMDKVGDAVDGLDQAFP